MRFLVVTLVILTATPALAQGSSGDATTGIAGLIGMFGLFGFLLALVYSIVLFFLPFMVWKCLRRLTDIRDDTRALRRDIVALAQKPVLASASVAPALPPTPVSSKKWDEDLTAKIDKLKL